MKSQGEIEAAVCDGVSKFQQEAIGRGPQDIRCHLLGSIVVVRLQGTFTPAERLLLSPESVAAGNGHGQREFAASPPHDGDDGWVLVKKLRHHVVANGRGRLGQLIEEAVGVRLVSVHHDISTVTGEEMLVFSLSEPPNCRPKRKP